MGMGRRLLPYQAVLYRLKPKFVNDNYENRRRFRKKRKVAESLRSGISEKQWPVKRSDPKATVPAGKWRSIDRGEDKKRSPAGDYLRCMMSFQRSVPPTARSPDDLNFIRGRRRDGDEQTAPLISRTARQSAVLSCEIRWFFCRCAANQSPKPASASVRRASWAAYAWCRRVPPSRCCPTGR